MAQNLSAGRGRSAGTAGNGVTRLVVAAVGWGLLLIAMAILAPIVTRQSPSVQAPPPPTSAAGAVASPSPASGHALSSSAHVTLVHANGYQVLVLAAVPLVAAVLVGLSLRARGHSNSVWLNIAAWGLAAAVLGLSVVGFLTFFFLAALAVVPSGVLLIAACEQTDTLRQANTRLSTS